MELGHGRAASMMPPITAGTAASSMPPYRDVVAAGLPVRKRLDHRGPLSIDVSSAWYFITICAERRFDYGRAASMMPPSRINSDGGFIETALPEYGFAETAMRTPFMVHAMDILDAARFRHTRGAWRLALFLIMPDHLHLIAHFPGNAAVSSKPPYHGMEYVISDLKRWLSTRFKIRFQRDFFDTRLRDGAHFF